MRLLEYLRNLVMRILSGFQNSEPLLEMKDNEPEIIDLPEDAVKEVKKEPKITIITQIYQLKTCIEVFKDAFPDKYNSFYQELSEMENKYFQVEESLKDENQVLRYVNPIHLEDDLWERAHLDKIKDCIEEFLNGEFAAYNLKNRLQKLVFMTNKLYNALLGHINDQEKGNALKNRVKIIIKLKELIELVNNNSYYLDHASEKNIVSELIFYELYQILKIELRLGVNTVNDFIKEHDQLDIEVLKAFVEDELSDIEEVVTKVGNFSLNNAINSSIVRIREALIRENFADLVVNELFWERYFEMESFFVDSMEKIDKNLAKIKILERIVINVKAENILLSPKTKSLLLSDKLYRKSGNERFVIFSKFVEVLSDDISYKDIYFMALLFGIFKEFMNEPQFAPFMKKYQNKYKYTQSQIDQKKQQIILYQGSKKYALLLVSQDECEQMFKALKKLGFDVIYDNQNLYINSLYFNGLDNINKTFTVFI